MSLKITTLLLLVAATFKVVVAQNNFTVVINEAMSDNDTAVADESGDFDDWIELYNNLDIPMDLSGYGLSDDIDALGKFVLPEGTLIVENGYLIIWADDDQEQGPLHAQFRLSSLGESIFLTDPNGAMIDQVDLPELDGDQAYARDPNGTGNFRIKEHSQGANNDTATSTLSTLPSSISYFPNPAKDFLNIRINENQGETRVQLFSMNGSLILDKWSFEQNITIDLRSLPAGNLFLQIDDYKTEVIQKIK